MNRSSLILPGLVLLTQQGFSGDIHDAARTGDLDVIETLTGDHPALVHDKDEQNDTPLHIAAREGRLDAAKLLIEKGADIHAGITKTVLPLMLRHSADHTRWLNSL